MSCTYLAHHELERVITILITIIIVIAVVVVIIITNIIIVIVLIIIIIKSESMNRTCLRLHSGVLSSSE